MGYFFEPDPGGAARRNAARPEASRVPPAGLFGTLKRLQRPAMDEGWDELHRVVLAEGGGFRVEPWPGAAPAGDG